MNLLPSNQVNLYEHSAIFKELFFLYNQKKLPNKILLSGEKGIGKCTLAYHFINYSLSVNDEYPYDKKNHKINANSKSFKLIQNKSNPNFTLIDVDTDKKDINITQIRSLIIELNKSSFNDKPRYVLIDNIELLNKSSINALLKILEEPNDNIFFILINNNKKILPTLKSRCLNFKILFTFDQSVRTIDKILNDNIYSLLNNELIHNYSTPGNLYNMIKFMNEYKVDIKTTGLKDLIELILNEKYYKKESSINNLTFSLIELYFRYNTSIHEHILIQKYNYFVKRINDTKRFNLDIDTLFMEFQNKILNE